ncbi:Wadjet anti-phage system protein JetD domain-containing protein [Nostoc sp.]|uniref:Wadjet anti-phage system protein JetD domain-containing protein n=1 Tax=Nostoc sp. TaxID=1180 RepID=UPI002FF6AA0B
MITPSEIIHKAERLYPSFLSSVIRGDKFFPIDNLPIGSRPKDYLTLREAITQLISKSKQHLGYGYILELETRNLHKLGQQSLPQRISIETEQDYLKLLKREKEFLQFKADIELIRSEVPELNCWLYKNPLKVIEYSDRWSDLLKVCQYFQCNPKPHLYIRELPIQIHTKFIEQNKGILRNLLEAILPAELFVSVQGEKQYAFEKRFSLRYGEPLIRLRILDQALKAKYDFPFSDISTPISEFKQLNLKAHRFFITENLMSFLNLPALENSFALFGSGYAIQMLKSVNWLAYCPILYWGDLDTDGFKILSQLRSYFPQTISIMMDTKTLETFKEFAVTVAESTAENLLYLTPEEQALYSYLFIHNKRLEQERISQDYAYQYVHSLCIRIPC